MTKALQRHRLKPEYQALANLVTDDELSKHTNKVYMDGAVAFLEWCQRTQAKGIDKDTILGYRLYLKGLGKSPNTINTRLSAVRRLAKEAHVRKLIDPSALAAALSVKNVRLITRKGSSTSLKAKWLSLEQLQTLLSLSVSTRREINRRFQAMIALLALVGLRVEEAAKLTPESIVGPNEIDVVTKGGKLERKYVPEFAFAKLKELAEEREKDEKVFKWTASAIRRVITLAGAKINVAFTPHDLRRSFAAISVENGCSIEQVQFALGHADPRTTMKYVGEIKMEDSPGRALEKLLKG